jgi:excisionase family DNA binding protein
MQNTLFGDLITVNQGAELLGVHPNTIRNLMAKGELKAERIGLRIIRLKRSDVMALLTPYKGGEFNVWKQSASGR